MQSAITAAGTLNGATFSTIAPVQAAAQQFSTDLASAITAVDAKIASGMNVGTDPDALAAFLTAQQSTSAYESLLLQIKSLVDRVDINLTLNAG